MSDEQYVTFLALAKFRGAKAAEDGSINGGEFQKVGLEIMGGCQGCGATLAAYNGYPSKSGYWRCKDCLCGDGWTDVAQANADIFGEAVNPDGTSRTLREGDDDDEPEVRVTVITDAGVLQGTLRGNTVTVDPGEPCKAVLHHGPGHQSQTECGLRGQHDVHEAVYGSMRQFARWRGDEAMTGFFDEPPPDPYDEEEGDR